MNQPPAALNLMLTFTSETASAGRDQICAFCSEPSDAFHTAFIGEKSQLRVRLASGDTYDANNLRVMTQDAGGTRRILLDGMEEMAEYDALSGTRAARYSHDPSRIDSLLGQQVGSTKVHAVSDALGSVYGLTDAASAAVSRYDYDVYGARTASAEGVATKFGFTGRVHDGGGGGEMYFRARYYSPGSGLFTQEDPYIPREVDRVPAPKRSMMAEAIRRFGLIPGNDGARYQYTEDSPATRYDPLGLFVLSMGFSGGAAYRFPYLVGVHGQVSVAGNYEIPPSSVTASYTTMFAFSAGAWVQASASVDFAVRWSNSSGGSPTACDVQGGEVVYFMTGWGFGPALLFADKWAGLSPSKAAEASHEDSARTGRLVGFSLGFGFKGLPYPEIGVGLASTFMLTSLGCCTDKQWTVTRPPLVEPN